MPKLVGSRFIATKKEQAAGIEICEVDGNPVRTMAFKGTGVCCETCRKIRAGENLDRLGIINAKALGDSA